MLIFLAGLISIYLRGDDNVADRDILDPAGDANQHRDAGREMLDATLGGRGGGVISSADFGDSNGPIAKPPKMKDRISDDFFVQLTQMAQDCASNAVKTIAVRPARVSGIVIGCLRPPYGPLR